MKHKLHLIPLLSSLLWLSPASAATESQLAVIASLGELNGIALQCRYTEQMQRIKLSLVLHLPKQRALGEWFEHTTNQSFMNFMNNNSTCPDSTAFVQQIDNAVNVLGKEFKK